MKTLILALASLVTVGFAAPAFAGDCKKVEFKVTNNTGALIKVRNIRIRGNDGTWTEDVGNKQIETNRHKTFGPRRLNKLDSGAKGDFTVNYDKWDAANRTWRSRSQTFSDRICTDGKTFTWRVTQ